VSASVREVGHAESGSDRTKASRFAALVRAHGDDLLRRAHWLTRSPDDAWDLYQDTLERALRKHSSRVSVDKTRNWLHIIMHNLFVDRCRAPSMRSRRSLTDSLLNRLSAPESPPEPWWWQLEKPEIDLAIARLSPRLQEVLSMHLQGLSYAAMGRMLALPINTVASRLWRARRTLCQLLTESVASAKSC
jgi:RNA polymerase sigma-70 factor, ECF subfamily